MSGEVVTQLNLETRSQAGMQDTRVTAIAPAHATRQAVAADAQDKPPSTPPVSKHDDAQLNRAVSDINEYVQNVQRDLRFSIDEDSGRTVIKVLDSETEEVIRQIPPDEVLTMAHNLEEMKGLLFDAQA